MTLLSGTFHATIPHVSLPKFTVAHFLSLPPHSSSHAIPNSFPLFPQPFLRQRTPTAATRFLSWAYSHFPAHPGGCPFPLVTGPRRILSILYIPATRHSPLATIFLKINTCKTVSKQMTLSAFRMNTYKNPGGRSLLLTKTSRPDRSDSDHESRVTSSADWLTNSLSVGPLELLRIGGFGSAATSLRVYSCRGE
jgi:hypothetical protein